MQCSIQQSEFLSTILEASRFTGNKALTPLLAGVFLSVREDNILEVRSSSGQVVYKAEVACQTQSAGFCIVPAVFLASVVKTLNAGEMTLRVEDDRLYVEQGKSSFELSILSGTEFPDVVSVDDRRQLLFPLETFLAGIRQVMVAASTDETKPVLTSVFMEMRQPNALVATDGFRLYQVGVDLSLDEDWKALLPARVLRDLLAIVEKKAEGVLEGWVKAEGAEIVFKFGNTAVQVGLVSGDFPPYKAIVPTAVAFSYVVGKDELLNALRQAMIFAKELSSIVVFSMQDGELVISSQSSSQGKSRSTLPFSSLDGTPVKFACNGKYILDFLSTLETEEVMIRGTESLKPVLFSGPQDEHRFYLVMPFKLPDEAMV